MKKLPFIIAAFYINILAAFSQVTSPSDSLSYANDSSHYEKRKLKTEEVNFVSGYYLQDGNHSAVTGGIGTEKLTDLANSIELKLAKFNPRGNKHTLSFELGIDTYTSASSDNIAPALSGPSRGDTRIYPSFSYHTENKTKGVTLGAGASYSHEYDYESRGVNLSFVKSSKNNNTELGINLFAYFDIWKIIYPIELRSPDDLQIAPRNSFQASVTLAQVINKRMQVALLLDPAYQQGQLTTLYQRVYFNDQSLRYEKLPDTRMKIPVAFRVNYFAGDRFIIRAYYRFYFDDWGNIAHTTNLEIPIKITPFLSLKPFYRFSVQSGIDYFAPFKEHNTGDVFYTSDYDLASFSSHFVGMGMRLAPPNGILKKKHWSSFELRYGHYLKSTGLIANSVTLALKFK